MYQSVLCWLTTSCSIILHVYKASLNHYKTEETNKINITTASYLKDGDCIKMYNLLLPLLLRPGCLPFEIIISTSWQCVHDIHITDTSFSNIPINSNIIHMSSFHMVPYAQTIANVSNDDCDTRRDAPQQTNIINIKFVYNQVSSILLFLSWIN